MLLVVASLAASAQFKEIKAAPFGPTAARQKIRAQLAGLTAANRDQTVATISGWLDWYRDILDEELIARWKSDGRDNLTLVMSALGDARVAREVVDFSWRTAREATFTLAYAPLLGDLMERYPASAKPFLDDLLAPDSPPALTDAEADTVCRIFFDMPDLGTWRQSALRILPRYRASADRLTKLDLQNPDQEKAYRAQRWRSDLKLDPPPPPITSRKLSPRPSTPVAANSPGDRPHITGPQATASGYMGPMSGTYESTGDPIPPGGDYVFPNIPAVKLQLDFDTKRWDARLAFAEDGTQVLVLHNKDKKAQKRCVVHWVVTGY